MRKIGTRNPTHTIRPEALATSPRNWDVLERSLNDICPGHGASVFSKVAPKVDWLRDCVTFAQYGPSPKERKLYCEQFAKAAQDLLALLEIRQVQAQSGRRHFHPGFVDILHAAGDRAKKVDTEAEEFVRLLLEVANRATSSPHRSRLSIDREVVSLAKIVIGLPPHEKPATVRNDKYGEPLSEDQHLLLVLLKHAGFPGSLSQASLAKYLAKARKTVNGKSRVSCT